MIVVAFILFAVLIAAWIAAPSGEKAGEPAKHATPPLTVSEAAAD